MTMAESPAIITRAIEKQCAGGKPMLSILRRQIAQRPLAATAAMLIAALSATPGVARAEYPERQITMIVCFPAGGGADIAARLINTQLGEALGKPGIMENLRGAARKDWSR